MLFYVFMLVSKKHEEICFQVVTIMETLPPQHPPPPPIRYLKMANMFPDHGSSNWAILGDQRMIITTI